MLQCGYSKAAKDWMVLEEQLFYRRGPWGIASQSLEQRWILDCFEGPSRMRRRIQHGNTRATIRMKSEVENIYRRCTNSVTVAGVFIILFLLLLHHLIYPYALPCIWNPLNQSLFEREINSNCNEFGSHGMFFHLF